MRRRIRLQTAKGECHAMPDSQNLKKNQEQQLSHSRHPDNLSAGNSSSWQLNSQTRSANTNQPASSEYYQLNNQSDDRQQFHADNTPKASSMTVHRKDRYCIMRSSHLMNSGSSTRNRHSMIMRRSRSRCHSRYSRHLHSRRRIYRSRHRNFRDAIMEAESSRNGRILRIQTRYSTMVILIRLLKKAVCLRMEPGLVRLKCRTE